MCADPGAAAHARLETCIWDLFFTMCPMTHNMESLQVWLHWTSRPPHVLCEDVRRVVATLALTETQALRCTDVDAPQGARASCVANACALFATTARDTRGETKNYFFFNAKASVVLRTRAHPVLPHARSHLTADNPPRPPNAVSSP